MFQTPHLRYTAFSDFLSGVTLMPRDQVPPHLVSDFFRSRDDAFAGVLSQDEVMEALRDLGVTPIWSAQGHHHIWLAIERPFEHCHVLSVFTEVRGEAELLMHAILWLEYTVFEAQQLVLPSVCVEHLRLQNPLADFGTRAPLPGQDFPSSGLYSRVFGLARLVGAKTGALCLTEVPQFFHTACLFSERFSFVDAEMRAIFGAMQQDLLGERRDFSAIAEVSRAFERGEVWCDDQVWAWPTELQAYSIDRSVCFDRTVSPYPHHFSLKIGTCNNERD